MQDTKNRLTRFLDDRPTNRDEMGPGDTKGAHQRVADAIVELVTSGGPGSRTIGLQGRWGAGKSSILRMVADGLRTESRVVVTFDAWAHEGDPLRRIFLETLIDALTAEQWAGPRWNRIALELSKRLRKEKITTNATVKNLGYAFGASALVVPIGVALVGAAIERGDSLAPRSDRSISIALLLGLLTSLAPLLVAIGNWVRSKLDPSQPNPWALTEQITKTDIESETSDTPEPTTLEFEKQFFDLMREALEPGRREIVLVVDNLDRVEPASAMRLWSAMQPFLQQRDTKQPRWQQRFWVIVPFDISGLKALWGRDNRDGAADLVADSFIDKTFPIRFVVPPPVLSNWRTFLLTLLAQAFPQHPASERDRVYRAYGFHQAQKGEAPTPRELKRFVNDVSAIVLQWHDTFPLDHIAYYALTVKNGRQLQNELQTGQEPSHEAITLLGEDLPLTMAALWFNVEALLAQELLLSQPILSALQSGGVGALADIMMAHGDRFWVVLELVTRQGVGVTAQYLVNAALCLGDSRFEGWAEKPGLTEVRLRMTKQAFDVANWNLADVRVSEGLPALLSLLNNESASISILSKANWSAESAGVKARPTPSWVAGKSLDILSTLQKIGQEKAVKAGLATGLDASEWISACPEITRENPSRTFWSSVRPAVERSAVTAEVVRRITAGIVDASDPEALMVESHQSQFDGGTVLSSIRSRLAPAAGVSAAEFPLLVKCLDALSELLPTEVDGLCQGLATDGHFLHYLHSFQKDQRLVALCLAKILIGNPAGTASPAVGNSIAGTQLLATLLGSSDESLARDLVSRLQELDRLDAVLAAPDHRKSVEPLIALCWKLVASGEQAPDLFTPTVILTKWRAVKAALDKDFEPLLARIVLKTDLSDKVTALSESERDDDLVAEILRSGVAPVPFRDACAKRLADMTQNDWLSELREPGASTSVLNELSRQNAMPELSFAYVNALGDYVATLQSDPAVAGTTKWTSDLLANLLRPTGIHRRIFRSELIRIAAKAEGLNSHKFLGICGGELRLAALGAVPRESIVKDILTPCLRRMDQAWVEWLSKFFEETPDFLVAILNSQEAREFFGRLSELLTSEHPDAQPYLEKIAHAVGIDPELEGGRDADSSAH